MSQSQHAMLRSEQTMLEDMLAGLSADRIIERMGLEERLESVKATLAQLAPPRERVVLTFRGEPVDGTRSILADFGGKAVAKLSEAVATVTASLLGDLGAAGPLPGGADQQLRIVDTATGSFGFELELPPRPAPQQLSLMEDAEDPAATALRDTLSLLCQAVEGNEEGLSDVVADIHPRAAAKVREFVEVVAKGRATFALRHGSRRVAVESVEQARRVVEFLREDQIQQSEASYQGVLLGILPESRKFECKLSAEGVIVTGRVDRALGDLNQLLDTWRSKSSTLRFREVRVRSTRPSRVLIKIDETASEAPAATSEGTPSVSDAESTPEDE